MLACPAFGAIQYKSGGTFADVSAVQYKSAGTFSDVTPMAYSGAAWYALISYGVYHEYHLFTIWGQSNPQGQGVAADSVTGTGGLEIKTNNTIVNPIMDPTGQTITGGFTAANTGSSWPAFAKKYAELSGSTPILLILGVPGAGLTVEWVTGYPMWSEDLYPLASAHVSNALEYLQGQGYDVDFNGIIWWQGETDAITSQGASDYQAGLTSFVETALSDFSEWENLNFYIVKIKDNDILDYQIRNADDAVAAANSRVFVAYENPYTAGDQHHSQAEYNIIGEAVAAYILGAE